MKALTLAQMQALLAAAEVIAATDAKDPILDAAMTKLRSGIEIRRPGVERKREERRLRRRKTDLSTVSNIR